MKGGPFIGLDEAYLGPYFDLVMLNTEVLKAKRWERGESQQALAERAGISENALNLLEQGKSQPRVSTVKKLADALEVPVSELLSDDVEQEAS